MTLTYKEPSNFGISGMINRLATIRLNRSLTLS
jgi:hypothetical protein